MHIKGIVSLCCAELCKARRQKAAMKRLPGSIVPEVHENTVVKSILRDTVHRHPRYTCGHLTGLVIRKVTGAYILILLSHGIRMCEEHRGKVQNRGRHLPSNFQPEIELFSSTLCYF